MFAKHLKTIVLGATLAAAVAAPALGADADWADSVNEGVSTLTKVVVGVAGGIIGLCIVGYGIYGVVKQRIELEKIWLFFMGGLLVTIGPLAIVWWIDLMQKQS